MSIIYNALQKTQRNLGKRGVTREKRWVDITLLSIIAAMLIVNAVTYYPKLKKHFAKTITVTKSAAPLSVKTTNVVAIAPPAHLIAAPPKEIEYQGKLVLNGVLLSEQEKVALIDNQPMHVGDVVDGKKIISIEMNTVKLADKDNILILRTAA